MKNEYLIKVVDKPKYSNAKGGLRLTAVKEGDYYVAVLYKGRALLNIDKRDVATAEAI